MAMKGKGSVIPPLHRRVVSSRSDYGGVVFGVLVVSEA